MAARPRSISALLEIPALGFLVPGGGGDVADGAALSVGLVWLTLASESAETVGVTSPEVGKGLELGALSVFTIAFALKAAAVSSPVVSGLTARTMPDLQSDPTEEKNLPRACSYQRMNEPHVDIANHRPQRLRVVHLLQWISSTVQRRRANDSRLGCNCFPCLYWQSLCFAHRCRILLILACKDAQRLTLYVQIERYAIQPSRDATYE